jgi:DNA-binding Lrp family transcriptional regulator
LHALQIDPRAPWNELAPVVGADAATLARRWRRLSAAGIAWTTGYSAAGQHALLEIEFELSELQAAVEVLQNDPQIRVLDMSSGSRDLLALARARDLGALSDYVSSRLGSLRGIRSVRMHVVSDMLTEGGNWRLLALTPEEAVHIRPPRPPRPRAARHVPDDLRLAIEREVMRDGRARVSDIADRTGFGAQRVADAMAVLRRDGDLRFRTDIARADAGWPFYVWYFVELPARTARTAHAAIAGVPEVRMAFTSASRYNLIVAAWLRTLTDVVRFEAALESALDGARIGDRALVLRIVKHISHAIGPDGRATGLVDGV